MFCLGNIMSLIIFLRMHLANEALGKRLEQTESSVHKDESDKQYISKFGFDVPTCCGIIPQDNTWQDDWVVCDFFSSYLK